MIDGVGESSLTPTLNAECSETAEGENAEHLRERVEQLSAELEEALLALHDVTPIFDALEQEADPVRTLVEAAYSYSC